MNKWKLLKWYRLVALSFNCPLMDHLLFSHIRLKRATDLHLGSICWLIFSRLALLTGHTPRRAHLSENTLGCDLVVWFLGPAMSCTVLMPGNVQKASALYCHACLDTSQVGRGLVTEPLISALIPSWPEARALNLHPLYHSTARKATSGVVSQPRSQREPLQSCRLQLANKLLAVTCLTVDLVWLVSEFSYNTCHKISRDLL